MTDLKAGRDRVISYDILYRLLEDPVDTDAYALGLIDDKGFIIRDPETEEEEEALTTLDVLLLQIKELIGARMSKLKKYMFVRNHENSVIEQIVLKAESKADKAYLSRVEQSLRLSRDVLSDEYQEEAKTIDTELVNDLSFFDQENEYDSAAHKEATESIIDIIENKIDDKLDDKAAAALADEVREYLAKADYLEDMESLSSNTYGLTPDPVDFDNVVDNWEQVKKISWYCSEYLAFIREQTPQWNRIIEADTLLDALFNVARKGQEDITDREDVPVIKDL